MASYRKKEAREWAREHLRGVANVIIPSYTADLKGLNEAGIRHDVRKELEYGFAGTLLVSEVAITLDEYRQFFEIANDESKGRLKLIHHASFNTFEENIEAVLHHLQRVKPPTAKGLYMKQAHVSATRTPSVKLEVSHA